MAEKKACTQCGAAKTPDMFVKQPAGRMGVTAECKECRYARAAAWRAANPDKLAAYTEATRERRAAYYRANREKFLTQAAARYAADPQKRIALSIAWQRANPERHAQHTEAWRRSNPEKSRAIWANRRARKRAAAIHPFSYEAVLWRDGYRCHICAGDVEPDDIHYDHVVPLARGGEHSYDNVRVAHAHCNQTKSAKLLEEMERA